VSKRISSAIIEGEAYALGFKGPFGTLRLLLPGSQANENDLLQQLADSFGGAPIDLFIRNRLEGLKKRVRQAMLPNEPRRGFDLIIEALQTFPFDSKEQDHEHTIAQMLGASVDDLIVRNVIARLRLLGTLQERHAE
jgi:hypothetical protein